MKKHEDEHGPETKPAGESGPDASGARGRARRDPADVYRVELEELGISMPWTSQPEDLGQVKTVDLLLYALDCDGRLDPDPAGKILGHLGEWMAVLQVAVDACPEIGVAKRIGDLERLAVVGLELHRRQRAALLDALAGADGDRIAS